MKFDEAIRSVLNQYATFTGRASRSEFWYWVLFTVLVQVGINILQTLVSAAWILGPLFGLAVLIPGIAVAVRRLHDIGKSGWNLLWALIPILGGLYVLYLYVQPSGSPNQYGAGPAAPPATASA